MSKRSLKLGRKSGVLPRVRPVFKRYPIRHKTPEEKAEESKIEQGFAEGIPLPQKKGFTFHRQPIEKPVLTVEERIKRNIDERKPQNIDESKLSQDEIWQLKRDDIRREHLREAYLKEAERLHKIEDLKRKQQEREKKTNSVVKQRTEESGSLTLPTIDSYLKGPIMRQRTPEEQQLVEEQRVLNRRTQELEIKERKMNELLQLYHAAANFITTEEELEQAIKEAFEVNVSKFESKQMVIENKLSGYFNAFSNMNTNENIVSDEMFGEINGQPGLNKIKSTLDGDVEKLRREAQLSINQRSA